MRITANKIDDWANTLDCRAKLPLLIRKLIYENINNLSKCKFPSLERVPSGKIPKTSPCFKILKAVSIALASPEPR